MTLRDQTSATTLITNTSSATDVVILNADGPSGAFNRSTLDNGSLTIRQENASVPTLTKTAIYGNCLTSEIINDTTTTETSSHTTTNTANSVDENVSITNGLSTLAVFNTKSLSGTDYQVINTASSGDVCEQRQLVSSSSVLIQNYTNAGGGAVVSNNIQANSVQTIQSMTYTVPSAQQTFIGMEADSTRTRIRSQYSTPFSGGITTNQTSISDSNGVSLTQSYNSVQTLINTNNTGCQASTSTGAFNVTGPQVGVTATTNMFLTAGNRIAMSVGGNTRLDLESINTILTNPSASGGGTTTIIGSGVVGKPALILTNAPSNLTNNPTTLELYYNKSIPGVNNDQLARISFQGEDNAGTKTEFAQIQCVATNVNPAPGVGCDGAIDLNCAINGAMNTLMRINGADNEINAFRPIDMNGQDIKTSSGNMTIQTTSSTGPGLLTLNSLQSVNINAGGGSGLSLNTTGGNINLNSTPTGRINFTTLTATATPTHNVQFKSTSNGVVSASYLKCQLAGVDIWIPYLTTDPTL